MSAKDFIKNTAKDFVDVWNLYPNVLVWCGVAGLILLLL